MAWLPSHVHMEYGLSRATLSSPRLLRSKCCRGRLLCRGPLSVVDMMCISTINFPLRDKQVIEADFHRDPRPRIFITYMRIIVSYVCTHIHTCNNYNNAGVFQISLHGSSSSFF